MTPLQLINKAQTLGVKLSLSNASTIQFKGDEKSIAELMPLLRVNKSVLVQWFELNDLYDCLAKLNGWGHADYSTWCNDLQEQPKLTMDCLKALKRSWNEGCFGALTQSHWVT
jgi:hypothetical protein